MSDIQAMKYRLVGAVVIIVGFALVWWLMLDHEAHRRVKEEQADIPAQTFEVERFDIDEPKPLGIKPQDQKEPEIEITADVNSTNTSDISKSAKKQEVQSTVASSAVKTSTMASKSNAYSALDQKGLPESWVIQLASVKNRENAQQLQRKLLSSSYPAYIRTIHTDEGELHRVLVGPKLDRAKAEKTATSIEKEFGIKGIIVRFQTGYEK